MCSHGKSMVVILALVAAVVLGGLSQASASEVLFEFGGPNQNINGYPLADYPNRSNGAPSPQEWPAGTDPAPSMSNTTYRIAGDSFTIGTTGQQYHIDQVSVYILWGPASSATDTTPSPASPQSAGVPLNLLVGQPGDIQTVSSSYTATRVWYEVDSTYLNYQRMMDGYYRRIWKLDFPADLTIQGGQEYYFFLDGILGNATNGYSVVTLVGANAVLGQVSSNDLVGDYDNNFYWYEKADGAIYQGTSFLPGNTLTGDLHVTITGSQVPIPCSLLLLGTGLAGLWALRRRRQV